MENEMNESPFSFRFHSSVSHFCPTETSSESEAETAGALT